MPDKGIGVKLKPCPFCGGKARLTPSFTTVVPAIGENGAYVDADIDGSPSWVECTTCLAMGQAFDAGTDDDRNAVCAWNRRIK